MDKFLFGLGIITLFLSFLFLLSESSFGFKLNKLLFIGDNSVIFIFDNLFKIFIPLLLYSSIDLLYIYFCLLKFNFKRLECTLLFIFKTPKECIGLK